jgi:hypothetical protein
MTLCGPLSCSRVAIWLLGASLLCLVVWLLSLAGWAVASGSHVVERAPAVVISYVTLVGLSAAAYTAILRQSAWFFALRPALRWFASITSAILLMFLFAFVFQIGFTLYAGW